MLMRKFCLVVALLVFSAAAFGQAADSAALKRSKMTALEQMAGNWRGSGWIQTGATREEFSGTELIQKKIDGLALLVEGKFTNAQGKVVHETLAVLTYDDTLKNYRFATFLANGIAGVQDFKPVGDHYEWGFEIPKTGTVRYSFKIDGDTWNEVGEFSRDGKTWNKTFEMRLERSKLKRPPGLGSPQG
jgi:hypothetical protein